MFMAFIRTRVNDPDHHRPYRVPGGLVVAKVFAWTCFTVLALAIVLFIYTPGEGISWPVFIGVCVTLLIGEVVIRFAENARED
jgi:hypothetical protein